MVHHNIFGEFNIGGVGVLSIAGKGVTATLEAGDWKPTEPISSTTLQHWAEGAPSAAGRLLGLGFRV